MNRIVDLKAEQFTRFVAKGNSVVLFSASWCKPCQEMKPVFHDLADKMHSRASFARIDVAVSPTISQMYGIPVSAILGDFSRRAVALSLGRLSFCCRVEESNPG